MVLFLTDKINWRLIGILISRFKIKGDPVRRKKKAHEDIIRE
jgi:hypothetical protein